MSEREEQQIRLHLNSFKSKVPIHFFNHPYHISLYVLYAQVAEVNRVEKSKCQEQCIYEDTVKALYD